MKRNEFDFNHIESHFILFFQMFYQSREIFQNKSSDRYWWAFVCVVFWSVGSWIKLGNLAFAIQAEDTKQHTLVRTYTRREHLLFARLLYSKKSVQSSHVYLAKFYTTQYYLHIMFFVSHSRPFLSPFDRIWYWISSQNISFTIRSTEDSNRNVKKKMRKRDRIWPYNTI